MLAPQQVLLIAVLPSRLVRARQPLGELTATASLSAWTSRGKAAFKLGAGD